jgi:hypothetical protein
MFRCDTERYAIIPPQPVRSQACRSVEQIALRGHERFREQSGRLRIQLCLIAIRAQERAVEQKQPAKEYQKHRAEEA